jgi:hypothetical protein
MAQKKTGKAEENPPRQAPTSAPPTDPSKEGAKAQTKNLPVPIKSTLPAPPSPDEMSEAVDIQEAIDRSRKSDHVRRARASFDKVLQDEEAVRRLALVIKGMMRTPD